MILSAQAMGVYFPLCLHTNDSDIQPLNGLNAIQVPTRLLRESQIPVHGRANLPGCALPTRAPFLSVFQLRKQRINLLILTVMAAEDAKKGPSFWAETLS